ncbi:hypothetical protein [Oceanirhabdus sp. W0125-5]|uniref:hypothetical protein n=1 Tax=Oceanirhabdus sp. W0125-5 TaxID=2999116 RepID=UPI0022F2F5D6|nr:hypothetical protein [Oceanirhabdus sp. W0125-5]WBW99200.1 hypothetical protein OW730_10760 [Oceanirhabdus sp. W0125-5]
MIIDILTDKFNDILHGNIEIIQMKTINGLIGKINGEKSFEIVYSTKFNIISLTFMNSINDQILKIVKEQSSINSKIMIKEKEEKLVVIIFGYLKV